MPVININAAGTGLSTDQVQELYGAYGKNQISQILNDIRRGVQLGDIAAKYKLRQGAATPAWMPAPQQQQPQQTAAAPGGPPSSGGQGRDIPTRGQPQRQLTGGGVETNTDSGDQWSTVPDAVRAQGTAAVQNYMTQANLQRAANNAPAAPLSHSQVAPTQAQQTPFGDQPTQQTASIGQQRPTFTPAGQQQQPTGALSNLMQQAQYGWKPEQTGQPQYNMGQPQFTSGTQHPGMQQQGGWSPWSVGRQGPGFQLPKPQGFFGKAMGQTPQPQQRPGSIGQTNAFGRRF